MGRRAETLVLKLRDFEKLDPERNPTGWASPTHLMRELWQEFSSYMAKLVPESEQLLHHLFTSDDSKELNLLDGIKVGFGEDIYVPAPSGPTETDAMVRARRGQQFFRRSVLNAYGVRCCISGINVPQFLVASHIKPWKDSPDERLNPRNGLCLFSLHDAAFDHGLLTLDDDFRIVLSQYLKACFPHEAFEKSFLAYEGQSIALPSKFAPDPQFLEYHRSVVFKG
jgi:putative restriction endonuclease